jgi:hypothetical protein
MIEVNDGAYALGNINGCGTVHKFRDSLLDTAFSGSIQGAGAVIEDDNLRFSG